MDSGRKATLISTLILAPLAITQIFPVVYMLSLSLKGANEIFTYPPELIPKSWLFGNFPEAMDAAPLARFLLNSLVVAGTITLLQVITAVFAAYSLARLEWRGKSVIFALILATMMVPGEVTIIPNYLTVAKLGWIDTYPALIGPFAASGMGVFLLYQFFKTIPKELEEAATVDGVSQLRFLLQFAVPLASPAIVGFSVFAFVSAWNQYLWPLIVTQSTDMQTAQIGIGMLRSAQESNSWGVIMAATTILVAPSMLLFIATQKQFVRGIAMSGSKG